MTAIRGERLKKLLVYPQASATKKSGPPILMFPPISLSMPPTEIVGSAPALSRIELSIEVVVVLPWVPAMAAELA